MLAGTFETKPGVSLSGARPEILAALSLAAPIFAARGARFVVTSYREGVHKPGSLHPVGLAVDLRIWDLPPAERPRVAGELGSAYQVILEGDHIHVEFDPRPGTVPFSPWTWASGGWPAASGKTSGDGGGLKEALPLVAVAAAVAVALG